MIIARVNAGPPTSGSSIVLISRPLAGRSERCGPGLNSPLRNLGNSTLAIPQSSRLNIAQVMKMSSKKSGTIYYSHCRWCGLMFQKLKCEMSIEIGSKESGLLWSLVVIYDFLSHNMVSPRSGNLQSFGSAEGGSP